MQNRLTLVLFVSVLFLLGLSSSAKSQSEVKVEDIKTLAGTWSGYAKLRDGSQIQLTMNIKEDGSFTSNAAGRRGAGVFKLADGKLAYQGSATKGTAAVIENKGKRTLRLTSETGEVGEYEEQK